MKKQVKIMIFVVILLVIVIGARAFNPGPNR